MSSGQQVRVTELFYRRQTCLEQVSLGPTCWRPVTLLLTISLGFDSWVWVLLTALVEPVQPVDVVLAHLGGLAEGHVAVGNGQHGGTVVLGEGVPGESQERMKIRFGS